MNLLHIIAAILLIGYISAVESDADQESALNRYKRSWKKERTAVPKCPAGSRAIVTCVPCPMGYYTQNQGFWEECVPCPEGKTTTPEKPHKCVTECSPGWTWAGKKCIKCGEGLVKADPGNHACEPCTGYWKANAQKTACDVLECPPGYEPSPLENEDKPCLPCNFGYYKKYSGGADVFCDKCRKDQWTISTASTVMSECIKRFTDDSCEAVYPEMVEAMQVAYNMTGNDTIGEYLCADPAFEVADIINLMGHVRNCTGVQDPVSGLEMIPVYRDETKEFDMASLITTSPSCVVEANSGEDGDLSCEQFWQSSSYYMSSYSSYSWSSGSFPWSSSSGWSSGSSAWPIGGTVWHPGVPMSAWSSGSWSSGSWSSGVWSSGSWSSGSWSSSGGPWWTSCVSSGYFSFPPMRPDGGRPFPGMFESGSGWSTGLITWSGGFQFPSFRDQPWLRGAGTGSGAGPNPGSGGSSFGFGPMSGSGIDPRFNRGGRIGNIVRK